MVAGMEFWERFKKLLDDNGVKIPRLSRGTGIPRSTLYGIAQRKQKNIDLKNVGRIADYFHVDTEYLATGQEIPKPLQLAEDEIDLITIWRKLSHDEQMQMIGRIKQVLEQAAAVDGEKIGEKDVEETSSM
jgi:transcriptional regulator with XRE-family HTH domain